MLPPKSSCNVCNEATNSWNNRRQDVIHEQHFGEDGYNNNNNINIKPISRVIVIYSLLGC
ncbi:MAG: hypothetical protein ACJ71E_03930 [Nitrososphaeraceae archaeon]